MLQNSESIIIDGVNFLSVTVKDIADRLPENSWLAQKTDEFADHSIFFHEGDVTLPVLRLGELPSWSLGYFIIGNVSIGRVIEASDDLAMGLIVKGNVTADHICAGGDEIYITSDLHVNGLFIGKYNHGSLTVEGKNYANGFISDDYSGWVEHHWGLTDDECFDDEEISEEEYQEAYEQIIQAIRPEFIADLDDADEPYLWSQLLKEGLLNHAMKHNAPIMQDSFIKAHNIQWINQPLTLKALDVPAEALQTWVEDMPLELSSEAVEKIATTMTGLSCNHIFIPQALYNEDCGIVMNFSEEYPDRWFIDAIGIEQKYPHALPYNLQFGMTSEALAAQFTDRYTETVFEDYPDSKQGTITLDNIQIELLLDNNALTYVKYQII